MDGPGRIPGSDDIVGRLEAVDVTVQDRVEEVVGRENLLVGLVGPELRRGGLREHPFGNGRVPRVQPPGNPVDHPLRDVGNHGKSPCHISVEGGVADRGL